MQTPYKPKHFDTKELVSKQTYQARGERSLELLDPRLLETIDQLRETLGKPITINNWKWGGNFQQRGLRDVEFYGTALKYSDSLSQHKYGRAVDFDVKGMEAWQVREHIVINKHLYPHISFLELGINWVHIDVRNGDFKLWHIDNYYISEHEFLLNPC